MIIRFYVQCFRAAISRSFVGDNQTEGYESENVGYERRKYTETTTNPSTETGIRPKPVLGP